MVQTNNIYFYLPIKTRIDKHKKAKTNKETNRQTDRQTVSMSVECQYIEKSPVSKLRNITITMNINFIKDVIKQ